MPNQSSIKLLEFVTAAKTKGASDEFLASFFARRGWPQDEVYAALGQYWEGTTGLTAPDRAGGGEASRDAFLYLLSFSTLATWASALGAMLFQFIDQWLPDPVAAQQYSNMRTMVTWQMASIAVAFPIFLLVMRTILREARVSPERLQSDVRKWLTYIALLLTATAMICDLIWFFDYFLNGELTSRFVLKCLTVMAICGAIFVYYLGSLKWGPDTDVALANRRSLRFGIGAAAVVVCAFLIGLGVAGTPGVQRHIQADHRRVDDLRVIAGAIYQRATIPGEPVPAALPQLVGKQVPQARIADPETGKPYEYRVKSESEYELCAVFSAAEEQNPYQQTQFWYHGKGRTCFTLNAKRPPAW
jgi:hypothetical protein